MFKSNSNEPDPLLEKELEQEPLKSNAMDIEQWLENLRRADRSFYNTMALEVWSIAKTMDGLVPGFWNRFMANRRLAVKQFLEQKQAQRHSHTSQQTRTSNGHNGNG